MRVKCRAAFLGPTGSGKTCTGLTLCNALTNYYGGRIGVIDTQYHQSLDYVGTKWAPNGFKVFHLATGNPEAYINAIKQFEADSDVNALLVDSMTDAWQSEGGVLDQAGDNATFSDWGPAKRGNYKLLKFLQASRLHVVVTVLADTQYVIGSEEKGDGKQKMTSVSIVGTRPIQDKKMMPKFSLQCSMDQYHRMTVTRTSFEAFDRAIFDKPSEDTFLPFIRWLDKGQDPDQAIDIVSRIAEPWLVQEYYRLTLTHGLDEKKTRVEFYKKYGSKPEECEETFLTEKIEELRNKKVARLARPPADAAKPPEAPK